MNVIKKKDFLKLTKRHWTSSGCCLAPTVPAFHEHHDRFRSISTEFNGSNFTWFSVLASVVSFFLATESLIFTSWLNFRGKLLSNVDSYMKKSSASFTIAPRLTFISANSPRSYFLLLLIYFLFIRRCYNFRERSRPQLTNLELLKASNKKKDGWIGQHPMNKHFKIDKWIVILIKNLLMNDSEFINKIN